MLGLIPSVLLGSTVLPEALQLLPMRLVVVSHMFLHGGWMHLGSNMLYLWIFGNNVEDAMELVGLSPEPLGRIYYYIHVLAS